MKFTEEPIPDSNVIHGYRQDSVDINGRTYRDSLVVSPTQLIDNWPVNSIDDLSSELLQQLLELQPEVILIGTGSKIAFLHPGIYAPIVSQGVGIEFMDSGAVCRTYNILLAEDRRVVAAIII